MQSHRSLRHRLCRHPGHVKGSPAQSEAPGFEVFRYESRNLIERVSQVIEMGATGGLAGWQGSARQMSWNAAEDKSSPKIQPKEGLQERIRSGLAASTSQRPSQLHETIKLLAAGGFAGAFSKTCTAPLARLTILYQVQALTSGPATSGQLSLGKAFAHVVRQEGLLSLWKGNGVTVIHRLPYSAINFWAYERFTEIWRRHVPPEKSNQSLDFSRRLFAGGLAGSLACAVAYPLDLVRTRLSAQVKHQYYKGVGSTMQTIVRDEGVIGLYRGLGATLVQVAPSLAINYAAYESFRAYFMARNPHQTAPTISVTVAKAGDRPLVHVMAQSLVCGSVAGLVSSTFTFPLDLVRRRLQLEGQRGAQRQYHSYAEVFRSVYRRQGLAGFYQGIWPEYYKVVPGVAIAFCMYELAKNVTGVTTNKDGR